MKKINTKEIRKAYEVYAMRKDVYYATKYEFIVCKRKSLNNLEWSVKK